MTTDILRGRQNATGRVVLPRSDLTFSICAYGESPYLRECIESVLHQKLPSSVILCTSTPNALIEGLAEEHGIRLFVNPVQGGIASDWNFALQCAETPYATIAHQDDIYLPEYAKTVVSCFDRAREPLIFFSGYGELRNGEFVRESHFLEVKRRMLKPLVKKQRQSSDFWKRAVIRFGSPIPCPSVAYCLENIPIPLFKSGMKGGLDWDAWERLSCISGSFCYDPQVLMYHRIHEGSETTRIIADETRTHEDLLMLERFWPKPIAKLINRFYAKGLESNGE